MTANKKTKKIQFTPTLPQLPEGSAACCPLLCFAQRIVCKCSLAAGWWQGEITLSQRCTKGSALRDSRWAVLVCRKLPCQVSRSIQCFGKQLFSSHKLCSKLPLVQVMQHEMCCNRQSVSWAKSRQPPPPAPPVKCASCRPAISLAAEATAAALEAPCLPLTAPGAPALGCCCAPPVGCCGAGCLAAPAASALSCRQQSPPAAEPQVLRCQCCCCCAAAVLRWRGALALAGWAAQAAADLQRPPAPTNFLGWESAWQAAPTAADKSDHTSGSGGQEM